MSKSWCEMFVLKLSWSQSKLRIKFVVYQTKLNNKKILFYVRSLFKELLSFIKRTKTT